MATTVQIIVAGMLLMAWIWVLGRPVAAGPVEPVDPDDLEKAAPGGGRRPIDRSASGLGPIVIELPAFIRSRARVPMVRRRRQRLLATMFAVFGAFFLAIALHGTFVLLFGLMLAVLVVHLGVASHVGARIIAEQRAVWAAQAAKRVQSQRGALGSPRIGAERVSDLIASSVLAPPAGGADSAPDHAVADDPENGDVPGDGDDPEDGDGLGDGDPFWRAAELAAALDSSGFRPGSTAPQDMVSDLIDQAWAQAPGVESVEPSQQQAAAPATATQAAPGADEVTAPPAAPGTSASAASARADNAPSGPEGDGQTEPIFTRPPAETRGRSRRTKARPIHIESELDDYPAAVNQR